jgi:hypothetical protein
VDKVLDRIVEMGWKKFGYPHKLETFTKMLGLLWVAVDSSVGKETATD